MRADLQAITIGRSATVRAGRSAKPAIVMGLGSGVEWLR
jgi:sRNA-binding protein